MHFEEYSIKQKVKQTITSASELDYETKLKQFMLLFDKTNVKDAHLGNAKKQMASKSFFFLNKQ